MKTGFKIALAGLVLATSLAAASTSTADPYWRHRDHWRANHWRQNHWRHHHLVCTLRHHHRVCWR